jgi:serine/threonine protein kinase
MDGVQAPFAMPEYVIPVAIVVPVVVAAGVVVLVALLVKKRNARKKRDHGDELLGDPKYISMATTQNSPNTSNAIKQLNSIPTENKLEVSHKDVILKHEIGAGAFGKVFIGEWQKVTVALKFSSVGNTEEFKQEAKLMIDLRSHPNVVQVLGLSLDGPFPILILEYCEGGSLESSVNKAPLNDEQIIDYAFGIARGMLHLHLNNIVHRDLAARNVLLADGVPKISDFGMARFVEQYKEGKTGNTVGPLNWMSPESLLHQTYSVKSDMWSFGCVLFELVSGKLYDGMQPVDVYHGVTRGQLRLSIPDNAPPVIKFIMSKCFEFNPDNRPTFEEVCQWLREPLQVQTSNPLLLQSSQSSFSSETDNESSGP